MSGPDDGKPAPLSREPRPKRHKIDVACDRCRERKVKCDGVRPVCGNCLKRLDMRDRCAFSAGATVKVPSRASFSSPSHLDHHHSAAEVRPPPNRPPNGTASRRSPPIQLRPPVPSPDTPASAGSGSHHAPVGPSPGASADPGIDSMTAVLEEGTSTAQYFGSSSAGSFTKQIKAAIDARLGKPSTRPASARLSTAAAAPNGMSMADHPHYVLPPRRQADHLMSIYWHYVDPLYPFLDRLRWAKAYDAIFAGTEVEGNERVFLSTLNTVLALSTQLMESLQEEQRESSSTTYFDRAQALLRLNIWDPGSLELVQCLLLMSQYLQCTNNPHQTWMIVGTAIRTAQSLGLHLPESSACLRDPSEQEMVRRIWHGCVLMDRMVSVTHGRPPMISKKLASAVPLPLSIRHPSEAATAEATHDVVRVSFFVKSVELYEIINLSLLAFYSSQDPSSSTDDGSETIQSEPAEDDLGALMKLDKSLSDWDRSLPPHLRFELLGESENDVCQRQAVILRIRFLQARLLLLRPITSRFCLDPGISAEDVRSSDLRSRVVQQVASLCIDTAQSVISILSQFQAHDGTVGLLPAWWYRIYYLYSAATILIVAQLRPDVFPAVEVKRSWDQAISILKTHEKFGQSVRRCVAALNILSSKVLQQGTHGNGTRASSAVRTGPNDAFFEDPLQVASQQFGGFANFPELDLDGLSFDANDFSDLNMHAWELLNQP
ncbi:hypothetical protein GQ53DRAFT_511331 [Thozetella sp. PMI_491]|nr:hypothetical protein GQ53DRAFT_511331 [Thozetella sp. PMI_491]